MNTLLVMFLGFPGSGKSYFAKQLAQNINAVRLNGDSMKTAIYGSYDYIREHGLIKEANLRGFSAIDYATEAILHAGHSVVYDANNNKSATRRDLEQLAQKYSALPVVVWLQTPSEIAKRRATERESKQDQPNFTEEQYDETLARATANFDEPGQNENLITIDGTIPFEEQYRSFQRQLQAIA